MFDALQRTEYMAVYSQVNLGAAIKVKSKAAADHAWSTYCEPTSSS